MTRSRDGKLIDPVNLHGIKCMSYGFVAPGTGGKGSGDTLSSAEASVPCPPGSK